MSCFDGLKAEFQAAPAAHKPAGVQVADNGVTGWVSDIATRQLYNASSAISHPAGTVVTGASGWNNNSGAYGWRPILKP